MPEHAPLLLEIGCEEIPARMIAGATAELRERVVAILARAGLGHGEARAWGGARRLAVHVEQVESRQADRDEVVTGPPADRAFDEAGRPTRAAEGFARKQGVEPTALERIATDRGEYAGLRRRVAGREVGEVLADELPAAVSGMSFPKTMRWGDGASRWVRPVHWVLALHGERVLSPELFGIRAAGHSVGHRFLSDGEISVPSPARYAAALAAAYVIVDPAERRRILERKLREAAAGIGAAPVEDPALLGEIADLVEWPEVVVGRLDEAYLELPRELLVTTLRHHQKCFSVQAGERLAPAFLAVSNNVADRAGHIRRGNEWVVGGRLDDARFFWNEDRRRTLDSRSPELERVVFHARGGSYAEKAARVAGLAERIGTPAGLSPAERAAAAEAARLCKNDLVTGTVGEFPELQGVVGGLLLRGEGADERVAEAVYEHYRPAGPDDPLPGSAAGCLVSLADKLDTVARLIECGERATGARDPFGLRRAANGVFRVVLERGWPLSLQTLWEAASGDEPDDRVFGFLGERLENFLRERGFTAHEVRSVTLAGRGDEAPRRPLPDVVARLEAIARVRERDDFRHLVELTKRVANILRKNDRLAREAVAAPDAKFEDSDPAVREIEQRCTTLPRRLESAAAAADYAAVVDLLAETVEPVDRFFEQALVIDPEQPRQTAHRLRVLQRLRSDVLTRYFDINELSGEADRRT